MPLRDHLEDARDIAIHYLRGSDGPVGLPTTIGRAVVLLLMASWLLHTWSTPLMTPYQSPFILAQANLIFHEAGHILFGPFGRFIMFLGGTLGQLLVPMVVTVAFLLFERNTFGAVFGLWWVGENCCNIAPYAYDAHELRLHLLTGGSGREAHGHDWNNMLGMLGMIGWYEWIGYAWYRAGLLLMALAIGWGVWLTVKGRS